MKTISFDPASCPCSGNTITNDGIDDAALFRNITQKMADTFRRKNHDYGNSFDRSIEEFGLIAGLVPISHKYNRLKTLISGRVDALVDESVSDTLLDMANYCIMLKMALDKSTKEE